MIKKVCLISVCMLLLQSIVFASFITIETSVTVGDGDIVVKTSNLGDEPAYDVSIEVAGEKSTVFPKLDPQKSFMFSIKDPYFKNKESYPVIVRTKYHDSNDYEFSAVSVSVSGSSSNSGISISTKDVENKKKDIEVVIENLEEDVKALNLSIVHPDNLKIEKPTKEITLNPREKKTVMFEIKEYSGIKGSTYAFYVVGEYESDTDNGITYNGAVIKDLEEKSRISLVLGISAAFLVLMFFLLKK